MSYYDHATEFVLRLNRCSKPRQLRNWELEQEAALQRFVGQTKRLTPKRAHVAIMLWRRVSKLLLPKDLS